MRRIGLCVALLLTSIASALGQSGQAPAATAWGNPTAARAQAQFATITALLDQAFCNTNGKVLQRGASVWACQTVGAPGGSSGQVQTNNGTGGFNGITNAQLTALINPATATLTGAVPTPPNDVTKWLRGDATWAVLPGSFSGFANPTAIIGLTAINGSATTAMRSDAAPPLSQAISPTMTGNWAFNPAAGNGPTITPVAAFGTGVTVTQSPTGTQAGNFFANPFHVSSTAALTGAAAALQNGDFECSLASSAVQGGVNCLYTVVGLNSATNASNANRNYVANTAVFQANSGDGGTNTGAGALGAGFAANFVANAVNGATNLLELTGGEVNISLQTGASAKNKIGWSVVSLGTDKVHGASVDAAFSVGASTGSVGFNDAYLITGANSAFPLSSGATILRSDTAGTITRGIDLSNLTITTAAFSAASDAFLVDGGGNVRTPLVVGGAATSSSLTLESTGGVGTTDAIIFKTGSQSTRWTMNTAGDLLGAAGMVMKFTGASSGTVIITPQSVAGTPTLALPNASGTFAVSASGPLALSATTGALTCSTCLTANQTITLSGDVTGSGATAITTTLATAQPAAHTWALAQTFTVAPVFTDQPGSRTALGLGTMATQNANAVAITGGTITGITSLSLTSAATLDWNSDVFIGRNAAAVFRYGQADAASPVAQTISAQSVVAGTSNISGANFTIAASRGTGTGTSGDVIIQTGIAGTTGTSQNLLQNTLVVSSKSSAVNLNLSGTATNTYNNVISSNTTNDAAYVMQNGATTAYWGYVPSGGCPAGVICGFIGAQIVNIDTLGFKIVASTAATSSSTGSLRVAGGASFNGRVFMNALSADTAATDRTMCNNTSTNEVATGTGALGICLGTSGRQFKVDIVAMQAGLADISKLKLWNYRYRPGYGDGGVNLQYGLVAQDVADVFPDIVRYNTVGEAINYDWGSVLMVSLHAIQELKADNDNLREQIRAIGGR